MPRTTADILAHADELAARFESHTPVPDNVRDAGALRSLADTVVDAARAERAVRDAVAAARTDGLVSRLNERPGPGPSLVLLMVLPSPAWAPPRGPYRSMNRSPRVSSAPRAPLASRSPPGCRSLLSTGCC